MFLKKCDAPRVVRLPDGTLLSRADLPPSATNWTSSRKVAVVQAVDSGLLSLGEALITYDLSPEEFDSWRSALRRKGRRALCATDAARQRVASDALAPDVMVPDLVVPDLNEER